MKYKILLVLFLIALAASSILAFTSPSETCKIEASTCDLVEKSMYSQTFGITNAYYGVAIFLFMIFLTYSQIKRNRKFKQYIIALGTTIGAIIAIYFLYLQQFVIGAYCKYCLIVDVCLILAILVLIISSRIAKRKLKQWDVQ